MDTSLRDVLSLEFVAWSQAGIVHLIAARTKNISNEKG